MILLIGKLNFGLTFYLEDNWLELVEILAGNKKKYIFRSQLNSKMYFLFDYKRII